MQRNGSKVFRLDRPLGTHWRLAKCKEVNCTHWERGWETHVDEGTTLGKAQAGYIRHNSKRAFTERREGTLTIFRFPPGQQCFREHRLPLERLAIPSIGSLGRGFVPTEGERWIEEFNETAYRIAREGR